MAPARRLAADFLLLLVWPFAGMRFTVRAMRAERRFSTAGATPEEILAQIEEVRRNTERAERLTPKSGLGWAFGNLRAGTARRRSEAEYAIEHWEEWQVGVPMKLRVDRLDLADPPKVSVARLRGRAPRLRTNHRTRGSRRTSSRAGPGGDDPPDDDEPARGRRLELTLRALGREAGR